MRGTRADRRTIAGVFYLAEILVVAWLAFGVWRLWRRSPAYNLLTLGVWLAALLVGWLGALAAGAAVELFSANLVTWFAIVVLMSTASFVAVGWYGRRWFARDEGRRVKAIEARWPLAGRARTAVNAALIALWLAGHGALLVLIANLLVLASDGLREGLSTRTLLARLVILPPSPPSPVDRQAGMLGALGAGWSAGVEAVGAATGARTAVDSVAALSEIVNLSDDERVRLVGEEPALNRLISNRSVLAALNDERVLNLIDGVGHGSLAAIYALGEQPAIAALFADPEVRAAIAAIDLIAIRDRVRARRRSGDRLMLRWELASIPSSLDLDARLADAAAWTVAAGGTLTWPQGERFALARTIVPASTSGLATLGLRTVAAVTCWVDDADVAVRREGGAQIVAILPGGAPRTVVVMLAFASVNAVRTCEVVATAAGLR